MKRIETITEIINSHKQVEFISELKESEAKTLSAIIQLNIDGIKYPFMMEVFDAYPFQYHEMETIRFINESFSNYNHVNEDGSICIHTKHSPENLENKLLIDLEGLIIWVEKYVINADKDIHYEHVITNYKEIDDTVRHFLFTDIDHKFSDKDFGLCRYSKISNTEVGNKKGETYIIQRFGNLDSTKCGWSEYYQGLAMNVGFYIFGPTPVRPDNERFAINNWQELESYFSQEFLKMIWLEKKNNHHIKKNAFVPILIGYNISKNKTHWQVAIFPSNDFPEYGEKSTSGIWKGKLYNREIHWAETFDSSYELFFGRGKFNEVFVKKKILLIGLGAVGSLVSETLTRCGAKHLGLVDFDIKEPGNICRSTYLFNTGVNNKTTDLGAHLMTISPFIEVLFSNDLTDSIKLFKFRDEKAKVILQDQLNNYDYIIDCTTDNDMLYILEDLKLNSTIISLSITNHANELICTSGSNIYKKTNLIFDQLDQDENDLFNPTGCWSPTFKASYSDISILVNTTLNEINQQLSSGKKLRNFYVSRKENNVQICQY